ncbi:MAG: glutaredoxin family protein [Minisyncoccia bacterium]
MEIKTKKLLFLTILFIFVAFFSVFILIKQKKEKFLNFENSLILYYSIGCPHCAKVDEFLKENKLNNKIPLEKKEVYLHKKNQEELIEKAKNCGITSSIGVPFLWDGKNCYIGDREIINFLKEKFNL